MGKSVHISSSGVGRVGYFEQFVLDLVLFLIRNYSSPFNLNLNFKLYLIHNVWQRVSRTVVVAALSLAIFVADHLHPPGFSSLVAKLPRLTPLRPSLRLVRPRLD